MNLPQLSAPKPFLFPPSLEAIFLEAFWSSNRQPSAAEITKTSNSLEKLWPVLAKSGGRNEEGQPHYAMNRTEAEAYARYYGPANTLKPYFILEEFSFLGWAPFSELRVLDFGCGPASSLPSLQLWAHEKGVGFHYLGLDQSKNFAQLGSRLGKVEISRGHVSEIRRAIEEFRPNLILWMNSFYEWEKSHQRAELLELLKTSKSMVLFIEPGSQEASRNLLSFREEILASEQFSLWLPCLNARRCGAFDNPKDWCHEEIEVEFPRWMHQLGEKSGLYKNKLLFSYLLFSPKDLAIEFQSAFPNNGFRVVSQRKEEKGLTNCFLCTPDQGKKKLRVLHSKTTPENAKLLETVRGEIFSNCTYDEKGSVTSLS